MSTRSSLQLKSFFGHLEQLAGEITVSTGTGWDDPRRSYFDLDSSDLLGCGDPSCDGTPSLAEFLFGLETQDQKARSYPCPGRTGGQRCRRTFEVRVTSMKFRERKR